MEIFSIILIVLLVVNIIVLPLSVGEVRTKGSVAESMVWSMVLITFIVLTNI